jgi:hypothetical protein
LHKNIFNFIVDYLNEISGISSYALHNGVLYFQVQWCSSWIHHHVHDFATHPKNICEMIQQCTSRQKFVILEYFNYSESEPESNDSIEDLFPSVDAFQNSNWIFQYLSFCDHTKVSDTLFQGSLLAIGLSPFEDWRDIIFQKLRKNQLDPYSVNQLMFLLAMDADQSSNAPKDRKGCNNTCDHLSLLEASCCLSCLGIFCTAHDESVHKVLKCKVCDKAVCYKVTDACCSDCYTTALNFVEGFVNTDISALAFLEASGGLGLMIKDIFSDKTFGNRLDRNYSQCLQSIFCKKWALMELAQRSSANDKISEPTFAQRTAKRMINIFDQNRSEKNGLWKVYLQ